MHKQINTLQYCRAVAAMAVVFLHAAIATAAFVGPLPQMVRAVAMRGFLGVDFFFVLSGFIIMHAHMDDARTPAAALRYAGRRVRRIYVPYLPVSLGMIALYLLFPGVSRANHDWGVLTSLTLFPTYRSPALVVAWTLSHEILFYSLFLVRYFSRFGIAFVLAWAAAILAAPALGWSPGIAVVQYLLSPLNLEFIAGMAAAWACRRLPPRSWPVWIMLALAALVALFLTLTPEAHRVWFGVALAPLIVGLALLERSRPLAPVSWLLLLGNASYAIYLVHDPVVSVVIRAAAVLHAWVPALIICAAAGTAFGVAYHLLVERPGLRLAAALPWGSRRSRYWPISAR
ncbi:acyltransferase family protein [Rhodopila globiformis]|nr:acyltransferase [Rhodopila globiformis]